MTSMIATFSRLPLTPALPRRERENRSPAHLQSHAGKSPGDSRTIGIGRWLSPLPAGEGKGEGESYECKPAQEIS